MMNAATRAHYRAECQTFERDARRAETQLSALRQREDPADYWKIEGLEEFIHDASEAVADMRARMGAH